MRTEALPLPVTVTSMSIILISQLKCRLLAGLGGVGGPGAGAGGRPSPGRQAGPGQRPRAWGARTLAAELPTSGTLRENVNNNINIQFMK